MDRGKLDAASKNIMSQVGLPMTVPELKSLNKIKGIGSL